MNQRLRSLLCLLLCACCLALPAALADDLAAMWQLTAPAATYVTPDLSAAVADQVRVGTLYTILDATEQDRWIQVLYYDDATGDARTGWIKEDLLDTPSVLLTNPEEAMAARPTLPPITPSAAQAETEPNTVPGLVLCETLSLREKADIAGRRITTLSYGDSCAILRVQDAWYYVRYRTPEREVTGWVQGDFVLQNPTYLTLPAQTPAFAYPTPGAKKVGLLDAGMRLPIIAEVEGYYVVSLRGASAFIQRN